jgi:glycosyltransferase involved in cell wall biosynthesis
MVDGVTGHIVPPSDPESLAAAIARILDENRGESMGAAGRERALKLFGADRMVEQIERLYLGREEYRPTRVPAQVLR